MSRKAPITVLTGALLLSATAYSGDIYKWTDENGDVHYEDRPVGKDVERVDVVSRDTDYAAVQASIDARQSAKESRAEARATRDEEKQTAADAQAEEAERQARCQESRQRAQTYAEARRIYKENEAGERVYLDDAELTAAREAAQQQVAEDCG